MFGEDVETGRVPSPWDHLVATPPSSSPHLKAITAGELASIPKLVPEVEEGNVEYKLKLLNPSPARFARLVTQLKWRLLEGGGQAYYELGVADSGMLVGLPRAELEASLETLEMMAGEIGASVIVVKEVEVPRTMVEIARKLNVRETEAGGLLAMGSWESRTRRKKISGAMSTSLSEASSDGGFDSSADLQEDEAWGTASHTTIVPGRLDDPEADLGLFSIDPEPDVSSSSSASESGADAPTSQFSVDLSIATVYKVRPIRHRRISDQLYTSGKGAKDKDKPLKAKRRAGSVDQDGSFNGGLPARARDVTMHTTNAPPTLPTRAEVKAMKRREARDKRRDDKRRTLAPSDSPSPSTITQSLPDITVASDGTPGEIVPDSIILAHTPPQVSSSQTEHLAEGLHQLHVSTETATVIPCASAKVAALAEAINIKGPNRGHNTDYERALSSGSTPDFGLSTIDGGGEYEARMIVEALVVRKLSVEEAFLDFEGFEVV